MRKVIFALMIFLFFGCQSKENNVIGTIIDITQIEPESIDLNHYVFREVPMELRSEIKNSIDRNLGQLPINAKKYGNGYTWENSDYKVVLNFQSKRVDGKLTQFVDTYVKITVK